MQTCLQNTFPHRLINTSEAVTNLRIGVRESSRLLVIESRESTLSLIKLYNISIKKINSSFQQTFLRSAMSMLRDYYQEDIEVNFYLKKKKIFSYVQTI